MGNQKAGTDGIGSDRGRALPFTDAEWAAVVAELELSPQQARIVSLVLRGFCNKEIAIAMNLSESTVRTYLGRIFQRLEVSDRLELAIRTFTINRRISSGSN